MNQFALDHLRRSGWLLLILTIGITACLQQPQEATPVPTSTTLSTQPSTEPPGDQPGQVIQQATVALADALGTDASAISMISMERQEFPDAALGCAQPGEAAAAVITPGYKVILSAGDTTYELHTNLNGTLVRCLPTDAPVVDLPDFTTPEPQTPPPGSTSVPTPDDGEDKTEVEAIETALRAKDYALLKENMSSGFWLGFYASEASQVTRDEAIERLEQVYLGPGLVRVYQEVNVEKLLADWTSAAPYARFVFSSGWGESQKDDAILLFEERADALRWAGLFYIFEGLKKTAYGDQAAQLPPPPIQSLGAVYNAVENKEYETLKSLVATPVFLEFYNSNPSELSPDAFVEALEADYLGPGQINIRLDIDVTRLLPDWMADPPCDDLLYSTGWGEEQADDGILCLQDDSGQFRLGGLLYVYSHLKETAYAVQPSAEGEDATDIEGMAYIPAGPFVRGSSASDIGSVQGECQSRDSGCNIGQFYGEGPQREITLSAFYIDRTEVTLAQFKAFVAATGYQTTSEAKGDPIQYTWRTFDTPERQDHPVRWMSWHDANAYCQWADKRLPTEAEWEKAARGTEGLIYPWGNSWDETRVPRGDTAPVDAFPDGASPYDVLGMAGGVWEWVFDWYDPLYYQNSPSEDPTGPGQTRDKVLRGGAFGNAPWKQRTTHRHFGGAEGYAQDHGFRCARDQEPEE